LRSGIAAPENPEFNDISRRPNEFARVNIVFGTKSWGDLNPTLNVEGLKESVSIQLNCSAENDVPWYTIPGKR
jgi:hypothetical protein